MGTTDRVAVVSGAASGMGLAIARHLAARGHRIGLVDLDGAAVQRAAEELRGQGATVTAVQADVTDRGAVDIGFERVRADLGRVGIVVASAGMELFEPFTDIAIESWERIVAVNLTGTFHCFQTAVADMIDAKWGRMVAIASSSGQSGAARMAHYVAAKGGVIALTKSLALELARHGITVNTVSPGMIDTPMLRRAETKGDVPGVDKIAKMVVPVGRTGTADEVAAACGYLCSDEAAFTTGQTIGVNGGMVL